MAKQMVFDDEARQPLAAGVSKLARAVRSTLGPRGRNAVLDKGWGSPKVTKDGVTVAEDIELDDPYENLGAQLVKEAASKTNDVAGDGTTTATVLAEAIFREGLQDDRRRRRSDGPVAAASPRPTEAVIEAIEKHGRRRSTRRTRRRLQQIATIAGNNDPVDRQRAGRRLHEGRQGRRDHRRRRQAAARRRSKSSKACSSTAATSRRTSSPIRTSKTVELENCSDPDLRREDLERQEPGAAARSDQQGRQAAVDHRRRRRRRSPGHAGGQQAPRHPATCVP